MVGIIINVFALFGIPNYYSGEMFNVVLSVTGNVMTVIVAEFHNEAG